MNKLFLIIILCVGFAGCEKAIGNEILFEDRFSEKDEKNWSKNTVAQNSRGIAKLNAVYGGNNGDGDVGLTVELKSPSQSSASWVSKKFALPRNGYVIAELLLSTDHIISAGDQTWHRAAVTVQYFSDTGEYIGQQDVIRASGSRSFEAFRKVLVVPDEASSASIVFGMGKATGKAQIHMIRVSFKEYADKTHPAGNGFSIYPVPYSVECGTEWHAFNNLVVGFKGVLEKSTKNSILTVLRETVGSGRVRLAAEKYNADPGDAYFLFSIEKSKGVVGINSSELSKPGGYRVESRSSDVDYHIDATSGDENGLYYASQSLRQMIRIGEDRKPSIKECVIRDWPMLVLRGIGAGEMNQELIENLAKYKINQLQVSGAPGMWKDWDVPLTAPQKKYISETARHLQKYKISGSVGVWPGAYGRVFTWSNDRDKKIISDKSLLYQAYGFESLLLIMASDYERVGRGNGIVAEEDQRRDYPLSRYHVEMAEYLFDAHAKIASGMGLQVFPFYYLGSREYGDVEIAYLEDLSALPDKITLIYGGSTHGEDISYFTELTGRKPLVRIPAPGTTGVEVHSQDINIRQILSERFMGTSPDAIAGMVIEAPIDEQDLREISDFMWNFGREHDHQADRH